MPTGNRQEKAFPPGTWKLQDAKARFSEVVRRAQSEGPQRVTVHGTEAAVVVSAEHCATIRPTVGGARTGEELIQAMQRARKLSRKLRPARVPALVRPPMDFPDEGR